MNKVRPGRYEAYLFDGDGTLIDTTELIYRTYQQTIRRHTGREIPRAQIVAEIGRPLIPTLQNFLAPVSPEKLEEIIREHVAYQFSLAPDYLRLFPGVHITLERLKQEGKKLALVTSRTRESVDPYFKELDIYRFFDAFVTPEATEEHKPHPAPAFLALELLRAEAAEALFIGDARYDMECAAAGVATCFVSWSDNPPASLPFPPRFVIDKLEELIYPYEP